MTLQTAASTMHTRRSALRLIALGVTATCGAAFAQSGSARPIRIIVPLPAGNGSDIVTRMVAPLLGAAMGQAVIVENKPGANGVIAIQDLMRSAPDGNTLLMGTTSPFSINVALMKSLPYDPRRDLTPISGIYITNQALMVKANSPFRTLADFIAYARQNPGKASIGHSTSLVQAQIGQLAAMGGVTLLPVPYKGVPAAIGDTIGGSLDATFTDMGNALAQAKAGTLRCIGITAPQRVALAPDWPAMAETLPGYDFRGWAAMVGPAGMPREVVARLSAALTGIMRTRDISDRLAHIGMAPFVMPAEELKPFMDRDVDTWIRLARENNLKAE